MALVVELIEYGALQLSSVLGRRADNARAPSSQNNTTACCPERLIASQNRVTDAKRLKRKRDLPFPSIFLLVPSRFCPFPPLSLVSRLPHSGKVAEWVSTSPRCVEYVAWSLAAIFTLSDTSYKRHTRTVGNGPHSAPYCSFPTDYGLRVRGLPCSKVRLVSYATLLFLQRNEPVRHDLIRVLAHQKPRPA